MAKIKSVKSNTEVYAEIIADIASRAAAEIEGAELLGKNPDKLRIIKDNDVHAYVAHTSKRVSVIAPDNVISKTKCAT